jgi:hypothetical protein
LKLVAPAPADQLSVTWPSPGTARSPNGAEGRAEPVRISMPLTIGLLLIPVNTTAICPDASAVTLNCSTSALSWPPATAVMSKLGSTVAPLIATSKTRSPT